MSTYTETKGHKPFDWAEFLTNNEPRVFLYDKWDELEVERLAENWETNPVGQLSVDLPRNKNGEPKDALLVAASHLFSLAIDRREQLKAIHCLWLCNERAIEIFEKQQRRQHRRIRFLGWWIDLLEGLRTTLQQ